MIVLCGGCCAGKTTLLDVLVDEFGYNRLITYTTRPMREGEVEDLSYHFITDEQFDKLNNDGFFAETTSYNVANGETWKYGTAKKDLTNDKIVILNPYGLKEIRKDKSLNIIAFYLFASHGEIWNRLRKRGDSSDEAARRIEADKKDFEDILDYVDFAINTDGCFSIEETAEIIEQIYRRSKYASNKA